MEITFTDNLKEAVETADRTVISIGTQNYPQLAKSIKDCGVSMKNREVILCMKGIIKEGGKRLSEATAEILGNHTQCAVWVGPGHVEDFIRGIPNCMLICSEDQQYARRLCSDFGSQLIRFYYSRDMIGCEIGAASKNVMGIAAGMLDGMGYFAMYVKIMIPLSVPAYIAQGIFAFVGGYNNYMGPMLYLIDNQMLWTLQLALGQLQAQYGDQPIQCAAAMVSLMPLIIIYIIYIKNYISFFLTILFYYFPYDLAFYQFIFIF